MTFHNKRKTSYGGGFFEERKVLLMAVIDSLHSDLENKYLFITFICYIILEIQASAFCFLLQGQPITYGEI